MCTAPDHGVDDFGWQEERLGTLNLVADNGIYQENTPLFAGQHVYKVEQAIIDTLQQHQRLCAVETIRNSYPHCWQPRLRSSTVPRHNGLLV